MAHYAGRTGNVAVGDLVLSNCDDTWDEQVDADVTQSTESTDSTLYKQGEGSQKSVCAAGLADGDIIASDVVSADCTGYSRIQFWAYSSVNITGVGDLQLLIDEHAMCASPLAVNIPVLVASTWKHCSVVAAITGLSAVISLGSKLTANDPGAFTLYLDDIRAARVIAGIRNWTLDYTVDTVETTDFADAGTASYLPTISRWGGTFAGLKDGVPLTIGSQYSIQLLETVTYTEAWTGMVVITGVSPSVAFDGSVDYSYTYQGTNALTVPTA